MNEVAEMRALRDGLASYQAGLMRGNLHFVPIRHHSPACAWHVQKLMADLKPAHLLVEMPPEAAPLLPFLTNPDLKPPVALYLATSRASDGEELEQRRSGLYPMLDFSPELVAIRQALKSGAEIGLIDLPFAHRAWVERVEDGAAIALADDEVLQRGRFIRAMQRKYGARDHDELWEALFETPAGTQDAAQYFAAVAAWCSAIRQAGDIEPVDLWREAHMRAQIDAVAVRATGPVLVLTGGFHLAPLLAETPPEPPQGMDAPKTEVGAWLIRTSWHRLDQAHGYGAGMPAPAWHDRLWQASVKAGRFAPAEMLEVELAETLLSLATLSRKPDKTTRRNPLPLVPTDAVIAAIAQARGLAALRNRVAPARCELRDAALSCFVKGDASVDGAAILGPLDDMLTGRGMGSLPKDVGVPPLVTHVQDLMDKLDLPRDLPIAKEITLEIYRNPRDRQRSRLLYALDYLNVRYGTRLAGPNFRAGTDLNLLRERWSCIWRTACEVALVDASQDGQTLEEACLRGLMREVAKLADTGRSNDVAALASIVTRACQMGLHEHAPRLLALLEAQILQDPLLPHHAHALIDCQLLWQAREPLGGTQLTALPRITHALYHRACALLGDAARLFGDGEDANLKALGILREAVMASSQAGAHALDGTVLELGLQAILHEPGLNPLMQGGAAGVLFTMGVVPPADLARMVAARISAPSSEAAGQSAYLRGLITTARDVLWQVPEVVEQMNKAIARWDRQVFLACLPELRLAFSGLAPRETDRMAQRVAGLYGQGNLGRLTHQDIKLEDAALAHAIGPELLALLEGDYLQCWLQPAQQEGDKHDG